MAAPFFSILIPTYNRPAFLQQAIDSVLAQDYPHFEVVISDNASTEDLSELKSRYSSDPRVRWFRNQTNIGLDGNWRLLVYEYAKGDFAKILADDDFLGNTRHLSEAARVLEGGPVDVIFAGAGSYDEASKTMIDRSWDIPGRLTPQWWMHNIGNKEGGKTLFPNLTTDGLFRLSKVKMLKAFIDPVFGMDYQLGLELMLSGPSAYLKGVHGVERKHSLNDGFKAPLSVVLTAMQLYDRLLKFGVDQGLSDHDVREFCRRFMRVMVNGFILFTWSRERGSSLASARDLYRILEEKDSALARAVMFSPSSLIRFFIGGTPERQDALRRMYYRFCKLLNRP